MKKLASISPKTLGFSAKEIRKIVEDKGQAVFIARVCGVAASYFTGESSNGEYIGFKGSFAATTLHGEILESGVAFFPATIAKPLRDAFENGQTEIEVMADIFAQESEKNASGYAYICEPVLSDLSRQKAENLKNRLLQNLPIAIEDKTAEKATKKKA